MYLWWNLCTLYLHAGMPGEIYRRRLRSLLYMCYVFVLRTSSAN